MACSDKKRYTKIEAQTKLNILVAAGNFRDGYGRIYHCGFCNGWHLTSHIKMDTTEKNVDLKFKDHWNKLLSKN